MKRVLVHLIIYIGIILLCGCHDKVDGPKKSGNARRTVILYMMAENSLNGILMSDINEMVEAKADIPDSTNVIIYHDDASLPVIYKLTRDNGLEVWKQYKQDQDSCDSLVLRRTIQEIINKFPARHYGLVMSSHGSGWMPAKKVKHQSIGIDNNRNGSSDTGTRLNITSLRWALGQLPKLDYIFFDACFMQNIEVAYELRNICNWIISSPAEIPGPGAPYDKITKALCNADIHGIVQGYADGYPCTDPRGGYYSGVLLSAVDCSALDALATVTREYLPSFYSNKQEHATTGFQAYADPSIIYTHFYDMHSIMYALLNEEDYNRWATYFDRAVPVRSYTSTLTWRAYNCSNPRLQDPEHYGGISMFVPRNLYNTYGWNTAFHTTEWYRAAGWDSTGW